MKTCDKIINFFNSLEPASLPQNIEILDPYHSKEVNSILFSFYNKYFNDSKRRILIFGINPGRFGGGLTRSLCPCSFIDKKRVEKIRINLIL